jgi:hypothetical protein
VRRQALPVRERVLAPRVRPGAGEQPPLP